MSKMQTHFPSTMILEIYLYRNNYYAFPDLYQDNSFAFPY